MTAIDIKASEVMCNFTIRVKGLRVLGLRLWLALRLLALVRLVSGCNLMIESA